MLIEDHPISRYSLPVISLILDIHDYAVRVSLGSHGKMFSIHILRRYNFFEYSGFKCHIALHNLTALTTRKQPLALSGSNTFNRYWSVIRGIDSPVHRRGATIGDLLELHLVLVATVTSVPCCCELYRMWHAPRFHRDPASTTFIRQSLSYQQLGVAHHEREPTSSPLLALLPRIRGLVAAVSSKSGPSFVWVC